MRKNEYGFTLIELLVVISILSCLLTISVPAFKNISDKNRLKEAESDVNKVYYTLMDIITKGRNFYVAYVGDKLYGVIYPFKAPTPSLSGENIDDFDYEYFTTIIQHEVFNKHDKFKDGVFSYNKVEYLSNTDTKKENQIKYTVEETGEFIINVLMRNATYNSYDTLTILSLTYTDKYNNCITLYV